jgi:hypothetical protein
MNTIDDKNLTRHCWINVLLVRADALDCTFQAHSWFEFCKRVVDCANDSWGRDHGGIARVFGCESGMALEEHTVADCRRIVAAEAARA